eukprot:1160788-Pelagomonas_calceolata.AAC.3
MTSSMGKNKECSVVGRVNHMKSTTVNASWARGNDSLAWSDRAVCLTLALMFLYRPCSKTSSTAHQLSHILFSKKAAIQSSGSGRATKSTD